MPRIHNKNTREPRQKRSIEMKQRIMEAARLLFSEKGLHGTSSNEIVEKAGVSIGSFYSYFPDKRTLYLEVLESFINTVSAHILSDAIEFRYTGEGLDIKETLYQYLKNVFRSFDIDLRFHAQTIALRFTDADIGKIYDAAEKRELQYIKNILIQFHKSRALGIEDIDMAAKIIHGSIAYLVHSIKFFNYRSDEDRLINELAQSIFKYIA